MRLCWFGIWIIYSQARADETTGLRDLTRTGQKELHQLDALYLEWEKRDDRFSGVRTLVDTLQKSKVCRKSRQKRFPLP